MTGNISSVICIVFKRWFGFVSGVFLFNISADCARPGPSIIWNSRLALLMITVSSGSCLCLAHVRYGFFFFALVRIFPVHISASSVFLILTICSFIRSWSASFDGVETVLDIPQHRLNRGEALGSGWLQSSESILKYTRLFCEHNFCLLCIFQTC